MTEHNYRAFLIGPNGRIFNRVDLDCEGDEAAKKRAARLAAGIDVELWDGARMVAVFKASQ